MTPSLRLRLKKGHDGHVASFALHRSDGTVTVQRQGNRFFPVHDLTHYAVETTLGMRRGFYALVADGWNFEDFGAPWPRGPLPDDADPAEPIVGFFDLERATGYEMAAEDFQRGLDAYLVTSTGRPSPVRVTPAQIAEIRDRVRLLRDRWNALPPGETLELPYTPGADAPAEFRSSRATSSGAAG